MTSKATECGISSRTHRGAVRGSPAWQHGHCRAPPHCRTGPALAGPHPWLGLGKLFGKAKHEQAFEVGRAAVDCDAGAIGQGRACFGPNPVLQFEVQLLAGESEDVFLHPALRAALSLA